MPFNEEFLKSLKAKQSSQWQCPRCYSYNDNSLLECRACDEKKPGVTDEQVKASKRPAATPVEVEDKKPKTGGFVFTPSSTPAPSTSIFNAAFNKPAVSAFKFGVGPNAASVSLAPKAEEEKKETKEEDADSDYMKYDSDDGDAHAEVQEQDYSEDEKAVDEMKNRLPIGCNDCVTARTPLSESHEEYDVYVFGSGDCGQLGMKDKCLQAGKPLLQEEATALKTTRIACGGLFNVIVSRDRQHLYSWGCNDECQLGREGEEETPLPISLPLAEDECIDQVIAGSCHVAVRTSQGRVFCWGTYRDSKGILGWSNDVKKQGKPTQIHFPRGVAIADVCCGENHTLALARDGTLYGWGSDEQGQLVFHMPEAMKKRALVPHAICFREGRKRLPVKKMWAGGMHSLVLLENGRVMTFGLNNWGQLGNGERNEEVNAPTHVEFFDGKAVKQAALLQHATIVLCEDGKVYSAGRNSYGQLGRKTEEEFGLKFQEVETPEGVRIQQIACGNHHCIAIDELGFAYTWGFGDMEQLGNGKYEDEARMYRVRAKVLTDKRVVMADGGAQHTAFLAKKLEESVKEEKVEEKSEKKVKSKKPAKKASKKTAKREWRVC